MKTDIYKQITNTIVENLEEIKKQRQENTYKRETSNPWTASSNSGLPQNAVTKNTYSGVNILVLWSNAAKKGYRSHLYLTFNQCKKAGGYVKKGEKGVKIVKLLTFREENDAGELIKERATLKSYTVFNIDQCENLEIDLPKPPKNGSSDTYFNDFIAKTGAKIHYGGNKACYIPLTDQIKIPQEPDFNGHNAENEFKSTLLHELTHWTGHKTRLNRDLGMRFGRQAYAMEELVAELGAAFLCSDFGVNNILEHTEYLDNWLQVLKGDNKAIFTAASKASQAAKFINELVANHSNQKAA